MGSFRQFKHNQENTIYVSDKGAVGDGTTIDTDAILSAITAAGSGGTVIFSPGKTYLIDGELNPAWDTARPHQTWVGYGAVLKRRNEVTDTSTTNIQSGTTQFVVTTPANFRIGMFVNAINAGTYNSGGNLKITGIVGSTITVSPAFSAAIGTGATIVSSFRMVATAQADFVLEGLEFDGNRSNNTTLAKWDVSSAAFITGNRNIIRYCYIHDEVGEGIVLGGVDSIADTNVLINIGGNGIHFTGPKSNHCYATRNKVKFTNIGGTGLGHDDGGIILSDNCTDIFIQDNYIEGAGGTAGATKGYAFGSLDEQNKNVNITGNIVRNCVNILDMDISTTTQTTVTVGSTGAGDQITSSSNTMTIDKTGIVTSLSAVVGNSITISGASPIEYNGTFVVESVPNDDTITVTFRASSTSPATGTITVMSRDDNPKYLNFSNNQCFNSGKFTLNSSAAYSATLGPARANVTNNIFEDCYATLISSHFINFSGNQWTWNYNLTTDIITITNCTDVTISDHFKGGRDAISVSGANTARVFIKGSHILDADVNGIKFDYSTLTQANAQTCGVIGNSFQVTSAKGANNPFCIYAVDGLPILGNTFNYQATGSGHVIRSPDSGGGCVIIGNNFICASGKAPLRLISGAAGNIMYGNKVNTRNSYASTTEVTANPLMDNPAAEYTDVSPAAAGTLTPDVEDARIYNVTMPAGNITIAAPQTGGMAAVGKGKKLTFNILQDGTGGRTITWNAVFKKAADGAGGVSQVASTHFVFDGTYWVQIGGALTYA